MPVAKAYAKASAQIEADKAYSVEEAVDLAKRVAHAKFDETVELAVRLGVNPKHADQMVRGAVLLPHGTGKSVRVIVFAKGEKEREAREAGADVVGAEDLVEKIQGGWLEFDTAVATPDLMGQVGRLGKILGPARPHAEPQGRDGDVRRRAGRSGRSRPARSSSRWTRPATCTCPSASGRSRPSTWR